jgi:hypothetical protein
MLASILLGALPSRGSDRLTATATSSDQNPALTLPSIVHETFALLPYSIPHPCPLYDKLLIVPGLRRNRDSASDALPDHDLEHQTTSYSSTSFLPGIALVVVT